MKWDEVEREFFVIGNQLQRLSHSFRALASALRRERENGTLAVPRTHEGTEKPKVVSGPPFAAGLFD